MTDTVAKEAKRKLSPKERVFAIGRVAKITYRASPLAVFMKIIGILVNSILPIVTTYFAALTTTALAGAYVGTQGAGAQAIEYMIITAALGIVLIAWTSVQQYIDQLVRYKIDAAINDQLYEQFLDLEFWRYDDKKTADLFDKAQQFSRFFGYVFDRLSGVLEQIITMIAGIIAIVFVSWWLGLILIAAIIPGIIIQYRLSKAQIAHWNDNVETRRMAEMIEWNMLKISAITELRIYGMVKHLLVLRRQLKDKDEKVRIQFEQKYIFKKLGADVLEAGAEVSALVYTALQIIAHAQPIGQFLYVQQIVSRALSGARGFLSTLNSLDEDIANLFDYNEFMALPQARHRTKRLRQQPLGISFKDVSFHYPSNNVNVLTNISLEIKKGAHVAIVGENGAGKSTLIKLLLGIYNPTKGLVMADEVSLSEINLEDWHSYLGVLQQNFTQFSFATAKDNVLLGDVRRPYSDERFNEALVGAEAKTFLEKLPKGVDTYVNQWMEHEDGTSGVDLSGGQWQRLALARNFYRDSPIIILDEPTSAIDALAESRIFKRLLADKKKTIITISHRLTTVEKADIIYMFEAGVVVEQGTHAELVQKHGAYFRMFESQLR
ncbi:MAG TPA: ABC transporter ATP-binding protein [Candidatus Microsaccharimonas sp.]|jgi:ATP-binding cassette subfamily B protein/ATP-binding cassette subfamily C protein